MSPAIREKEPATYQSNGSNRKHRPASKIYSLANATALCVEDRRIKRSRRNDGTRFSERSASCEKAEVFAGSGPFERPYAGARPNRLILLCVLWRVPRCFACYSTTRRRVAQALKKISKNCLAEKSVDQERGLGICCRLAQLPATSLRPSRTWVIPPLPLQVHS